MLSWKTAFYNKIIEKCFRSVVSTSRILSFKIYIKDMKQSHYACLVLPVLMSLISGFPEGQGDNHRYCGVGWVNILDRCYHFSREMDNWSTAVVRCKALSAKLAEIETAEEETFMRIYIEDHLVPGQLFWIGGTDELQEKYWVWISEDRVITYSDWSPGEPNNYNSGENCLEIDGTRNNRWNDDDCHLYRKFICEKQVESHK